MDLQQDFTSQSIELPRDYEGEVTATLISSKFNTGNRKSILYLHGYIDYFFHAHMGEKFSHNQFDFYALDLRKYGRSLLQHQHPNYCKDIEEYYEEISTAIVKIHNTSNSPIYLLGHSTGGLIASNYMNNGKQRNLIRGLILNSPFLDFNQSSFAKSVSYWTAKIMSAISAYSKVSGAISPVYAKSIHKDFYGEWDFNLKWKPIEGFPTYLVWVLAIGRAQKKLANSKIDVPILVMHSSDSKKASTFSEDDMCKDIVLDIEDIKRVGLKLGDNVTLLEIDNAQHDIFLSPKVVREAAFDKMFSWLETVK